MKSWIKLSILFCAAAAIILLSFKASACDGNCVTSTLQSHTSSGRATYKTGASGTGYYAKGTDVFLGTSGSAYVSLGASSDAFDSIVNYYEQYGYQMQEIYYAGCGNQFGVVFAADDECYCCSFVVNVYVTKFVQKSCDSDCDGLNDAWEYTTFGTLNKDGLSDYDRDGVSDYVEYMAGSNPKSATSIPLVGNYYNYDNLGRITNIVIMD